MSDFTPLSASVGGALIGLAATILMAFNGRIAGVSGILSGAALEKGRERRWRVLFVVGLALGPIAVSATAGERPAFELAADWPSVIAGGLLVGFGARLGSGCTSGHGVCGLSRLSPRSFAAVATFMASGVAAATLLHGVIGA